MSCDRTSNDLGSRHRQIIAIVVVVLGLAALESSQFAKSPVAQPMPLREMALTFDDLPYSTSWTNTASLAVARKLGLKTCASGWSVCD
jgi:hypothetical protein